MIDSETILSIQEKIINSEAFGSSQTHRHLLEYLIKANLNHEIVKETTIASEVFGRDLDSESNDDPLVRVHMHNLRQKLNSYYENEGRDDKYRLEIPKGHYSIQFSPVSKIKKLTRSKLIKSTAICAAIICISLSVLTFYFWRENNSLVSQLESYAAFDKDNKIWHEIISSDHQTLIVLGDHHFFSEYDMEMRKWRYIRDKSINSSEDFEYFRNLYPDKLLKNTADSYFPDGSIWSLPPLLYALQPIQKRLSLHRITRLTPQMLHENNVIFLGSTKTLGLFERYLNSSDIEFQLNPHRILYRSGQDTRVDTLETQYNNTSGYHIDYAIALKYPGPDHNIIMIISSFFSSGVPELTKYLTNPASLSELEDIFIQKFDRIPPYFGIIAEVRGLEKTGFYIEIKHIKEINEEVNIW